MSKNDLNPGFNIAKVSKLQRLWRNWVDAQTRMSVSFNNYFMYHIHVSFLSYSHGLIG